MSKLTSSPSSLPSFLLKPNLNLSLFFILPFLLIRDVSFTFSVTTNPYLLILAQTSILAISVGFTRPKSIVRYGLFPASILLCAKALASLRAGWTDSFAMSTCLGYITAWEVLQYLVIALIEPWDFRSQGQVANAVKNKKRPNPPKDTITNRLLFGYDAAYSQRHSGTSFAVSNVPAFDSKNPTYTPSRISWLASTSLYVAISYILLDLVALANDPEMAATMAAAEKVPFFSRISDVTLEEALQRLVAVMSVWILAVPVIYLSKRMAPILFVALGLQRVEQYKPLFNFAEGMPWSVRRFWSHFWHQMFKDKLYLPCKYLCDDILHLPHGTVLRRYSLIVLTFALSGVAHVAGEYASGMDMWKDSGAMQFFVNQAFGIIVEDFAVYLWQMQFGKGKQTAWQVWVGRMWVVLFMFWSVPIWGYPQARLGDGSVVPWSVVRALRYGK